MVVESVVGTDSERGARILAKSFFRELKTKGYSIRDVIVVAATLVDLVTSDARSGK